MRKLLPIFLMCCLLLASCGKEKGDLKDTGDSGNAQASTQSNAAEADKKDQPADAAKEGIPSGQVTLYPAYLQVPIGQHVTLEAQPEGKKFTWSSSNTSVATVDENGRITPMAEGEAIISATLADDASVTAACGVLVVAEGNIYLWDEEE